MNLGFFTMPMHPLGKDWRRSLQEDRAAFLLADELGFTEAYVGEHVTDRAENITSGIAFLAWGLRKSQNRKVKAGTLVLVTALLILLRPVLPHRHPVLAAVGIALTCYGHRVRLAPPVGLAVERVKVVVCPSDLGAAARRPAFFHRDRRLAWEREEC